MIELIEYNGYWFQVDVETPFVRFKRSSSPKLPARPAPTPTPESIQDTSLAAGEREARLRKRQKGRRSTILTEGGLGIPENQGLEQKKSLLG
jgi:hypothetical protein